MKHEDEIVSYIESAPYIYGQAPTVVEIGEACGLSARVAYTVVSKLYSMGRVHVAALDQDTSGRWTLRRFGAGAGDDAVAPPPKTVQERVRDFRVRLKAGVVPKGRKKAKTKAKRAKS